jgi:hypothetical protein
VDVRRCVFEPPSTHVWSRTDPRSGGTSFGRASRSSASTGTSGESLNAEKTSEPANENTAHVKK